MFAVVLFHLRAMEAIEATLEFELAADEIRAEAEPLEVVAAQWGGLVGETEPLEGFVPRAAVVARSGLLEVNRHRGTMYCGSTGTERAARHLFGFGPKSAERTV